jgi:hypothetical protein
MPRRNYSVGSVFGAMDAFSDLLQFDLAVSVPTPRE